MCCELANYFYGNGKTLPLLLHKMIIWWRKIVVAEKLSAKALIQCINELRLHWTRWWVVVSYGKIETRSHSTLSMICRIIQLGERMNIEWISSVLCRRLFVSKCSSETSFPWCRWIRFEPQSFQKLSQLKFSGSIFQSFWFAAGFEQLPKKFGLKISQFFRLIDNQLELFAAFSSIFSRKAQKASIASSKYWQSKALNESIDSFYDKSINIKDFKCLH